MQNILESGLLAHISTSIYLSLILFPNQTIAMFVLNKTVGSLVALGGYEIARADNF